MPSRRRRSSRPRATRSLKATTADARDPTIRGLSTAQRRPNVAFRRFEGVGGEEVGGDGAGLLVASAFDDEYVVAEAEALHGAAVALAA